jgi:glycosyltransferase involved in cell wall biosynthesis
VKTGQTSLSVVQVNCAFDKGLADPDALLDRYATLTGWSDALAAAGAARVTVVQRFHRRAKVTRNGIDYRFVDRGLPRAVAAAGAEVAHVNGLTFPLSTWRLRRALPRPTAIVVQNHADGGAVGRASLRQLLGRLTRSAVDAFLFAADEHAAPWRRAGFIAPGQPTYQVMEASTTVQPVNRAAARAQSGVDGFPALLWVGRLNANKDPLIVLDGFDRSLGALPAAVLTMIYTAEDVLPAVRERIARSALLKERVRLVGTVPHARLPAFYSAADLFVLGSHHEGSGYALMEACACGAVPVVTDIPTFRLLTDGGAVGALWTPGDAAGLERALVDVCTRDLSSERARVIDRFARNWSWPSIGRRAIEIYEDILRRRRERVGRPF